MECAELFEEVGCEEYFVEDDDYRAWMDALEIEYVNGELQVIADEQNAAQVALEAEFVLFGV